MKYTKALILGFTLLGLTAPMMPLQAGSSAVVTVVVQETVRESTGSNIGKAAECLWDATCYLSSGMFTVAKACYQAMPSSLTVSRAFLQSARVMRATSQTLYDHPVLLAGLVGFGAGVYVCKSDVLNRIKAQLPGGVKHVTLRIVDTSGRLVGWAIGHIA